MVTCPETTTWPMVYTLTPVTDTNYDCTAFPVVCDWTWDERQMRSDLSSLSYLWAVKASTSREIGPDSSQQAHTLPSKQVTGTLDVTQTLFGDCMAGKAR